jgi:hypothetical protein
VNGSTNMKDIVAGGNASVALALTSAATTVYQSTLGPSTATTPVTLNLHKIFNLATKIESLAVAIASDGLFRPEPSVVVAVEAVEMVGKQRTAEHFYRDQKNGNTCEGYL